MGNHHFGILGGPKSSALAPPPPLPKETQLSRPPPGPEEPAATLLSMRGHRGFGTPEAEGELCIQGTWVKKLADPSTKWRARPPHSTTEFEFRLWAPFFVSSNSKITFTKVDGGIARRAVVVPYEWHFTQLPTEPHHAQAAAIDIKEPNFVMPQVPGYLRVLMAWYKATWMQGAMGLGRLPKVIEQATADMLADEFQGVVEAFMAEHMVSCNSAAAAATKTKVLQELARANGMADVKPRDRTRAVERVLTFATHDGFRERARPRPGGHWLRLRTEADGPAPTGSASSSGA